MNRKGPRESGHEKGGELPNQAREPLQSQSLSQLQELTERTR